MQNAAIPPVLKSIRVAAPPARAFELFTAGMHQWWPRAHTLHPKSERVAIVVEPWAGGRWFERTADGTRCDWGHVLVWTPPERVVFAWQLDETWKFNPQFTTEVEISFAPADGQQTLVKLEHRNLERYGVHAAKVRGGLDSNEGWMGGLQLYAAALATGQSPGALP